MSHVPSPSFRDFFWRRLHSLLGLWLTIFLVEHLVTNSQAVLLPGENGAGFIRAVNFLQSLPFLPIVEIVLMGAPIAVHAIWGMRYLLTAKSNVYSKSFSHPSLFGYLRNHAYFWQRLSSWILILGLISHVIHMRVLRYPTKIPSPSSVTENICFISLRADPKLYVLANRLGVALYNKDEIEQIKKGEKEEELLPPKADLIAASTDHPLSHQDRKKLTQKDQEDLHKQNWIRGLTSKPLKEGEVMAETKDFGTAALLMVRDAFKNIWVVLLYTLFLLAAVFHAFNGLWTFLITWGVILKMRTQSRAATCCMGLAGLFALLGLSAIWGPYIIDFCR